MKKKEVKICPLMSMQFHSIDMSAGTEECVKEKCAWWVERPFIEDNKLTDDSGCAIKLIGEKR